MINNRVNIRVIFILSVLLVFSISSVPVFAGQGVSIIYGDTVKHSKPVKSINQAFISDGKNNKYSERSLYFNIQKKTSSGYVDNKYNLVKPGEKAPHFKSTTGKGDYRLELNPYGVKTYGCIGDGIVAKYK